MSMETPFGSLRDINLDDAQAIYDILAHDKHSVAEGMVVESLFDQIIEYIPKVVEGSAAILLDVETFITRDREDFNLRHAFVWARTKGEGLGRYLNALEKGFRVYLLEWVEDSAFFMARVIRRGRTVKQMPLAELVEELGRRHGKKHEVAAAVKDAERHLGAFWGYLKQRPRGYLKYNVALPRLLVNWGIQPWFTSVWNIDRIVIMGDSIWALEVKHKFPYGDPGPLEFGLNTGEAYLLKDLVKIGINALHAIIVKPYWDKKVGSSYLVTDFDVRDKALLLGVTLRTREISRILAAAPRSSPSHTSIDGQTKQKFYGMAATDFNRLSFLCNREEIAKRLCLLLQGKLTDYCSDDQLRSLRIGKT